MLEDDHSPSSRSLELVPVFATADRGLMALAKSILIDAEIPFVPDESAALFGFKGRIRVSRDDAEDARGLLADLGS